MVTNGLVSGLPYFWPNLKQTRTHCLRQAVSVTNLSFRKTSRILLVLELLVLHLNWEVTLAICLFVFSDTEKNPLKSHRNKGTSETVCKEVCQRQFNKLLNLPDFSVSCSAQQKVQTP